MSNQVLLKRSNVPGRVPTIANVSAGEIAVNTADGRLFFGTGTSVVEVITEFGIVPASVDILNATTINLANGATLDSGLLITNSTATWTLNSMSLTQVRSMEYLVQASCVEGYQLIKVLAIHDGVNANIVPYGNINTGSPIFTIDAQTDDTNIYITVSPNYTDVTFQWSRTLLDI